jgi:hypothetical protein
MAHNVSANSHKEGHGHPASWHTMAGGAPLEIRWRETADRLAKLGGVAAVPISEQAVAQMEAEIARLTPAEPAAPRDDPLLEKAAGEFDFAAKHYRNLFVKIEQRRKQLSKPSYDVLMRILGLAEIPLPESAEQMIERLFDKQTPPRYPGHLSLPVTDMVETYVAATRLIADAALPLQRIVARFHIIESFEEAEHYPQRQQRLLVEQVFLRLEEFAAETARAARLRAAHLAALEERIERLERPKRQRRKSK